MTYTKTSLWDFLKIGTKLIFQISCRQKARVYCLCLYWIIYNVTSHSLMAGEVNSGSAPMDLTGAQNFIIAGKTALDGRKWDDAINFFSQAIQLDQKNTQAYEGRAFAYFARHDFKKAVVDYTQVIKLDPTNSGAFLNRGAVHRCLDDCDRAIADFSRCLKLNPAEVLALNSRASVYNRKGDFSKAINDCSKSLQLKQNDDQVYVMRGQYFSNNRQYEQAMADYKRAAQINHTNEDAYNDIAFLCAVSPVLSMHDSKAAIDNAKKACALARWRKWQYIDTLAISYAEDDDFDKAIFYEKQAFVSSQSDDEARKITESRLELFRQKKPYYEVNPMR